MVAITEQTKETLQNWMELSPADEAPLVLLAIQKCTALEKAHSRHSIHLFLTRHAVNQHRSELSQSLQDPAIVRGGITIHDLEHFAPQWRSLVPTAPATRAALAHLLSKEYTFTHGLIPQMRAALHLDEPGVRQAFEQLFGQSLDEIYANKLPLGARLHRAFHAVSVWPEHLPPFWIAFALTLPVGPGLLALPIAMAQIGPLPGVFLLLFFGIINIVTVAALSEALTRSSNLRDSKTFFLGHLVSEYLGEAGSLIFTSIFVIDLVLVLLIFYLGVASTLSDATHLPPALWAALLFLIGIYFLSRKSLNTTLGFTIIVGIVNVSLILVLTLLAFTHVQVANLIYVSVPFIDGHAFDPTAVRLIFGVVLATYFSHMLVGNYGKLVLRHDPSGRALMQGSIAAIGFTTVVSVLWVLAMNGALDPSVLKDETGTVLIPLSAQMGAAVRALGSIFVVIGLGMASIHISLGLFFTVREWLASDTLRRFTPGEPLRTILTVSPVILIFVIAEWMLTTGNGSFSELFGFVGVIALSLLAAIFPMLLLMAARRKGELVPPTGVYPILAHPLLVGGICAFFLVAIFLHGAILWADPVERAGALAIGLLIMITTAVMIRNHAFSPRLIIKVRQDASTQPVSARGVNDPEEARGEFGITSTGLPRCANVRLVYSDREETTVAESGIIPSFSHLTRAEFRVGTGPARDLKVSAHAINLDGDLESLPLQLTILRGDQRNQLSLHDAGGEVILPLGEGDEELELFLTRTGTVP